MPNTSSVVDDFNGGSLDTGLWSGTYGTVTETGGRARIACDTGWSGLQTDYAYSLDSIHMQLWAPEPDTATECYLDLVLYSPGQAAGTDINIHIDAVAGTICGRTRVGYWDGTEVPITYDPDAHAWVRIRVSGGDLIFEVSADSRSWTALRSITTPAWLAAATDISVNVESHRDAGTADFAEVDNVNLVGGTLFTTQTPTSVNNSDGTPGITFGTTVRFTQDGQVTGVRWYTTTTVGGTYIGALYEVTAADDPTPAGTLHEQETLVGSPTGGGWQSITFDSPVPVTAGVLYRAAVYSSAGRYVYSADVHNSDIVNGDLVADAAGDDPVGLGTLRQATFTIGAGLAYPATGAGSNGSYFADVEFTTASGPTPISVGDAGAAADALTATATAGLSESGAATATLAVGAITALADVAAAADSFTVPAGTLALADTGISTQQLAAAVVVQLADLAGGADGADGSDDSDTRSLSDGAAAAERLRTATVRPNTGTTARPDSGITPRP